MDDAILGLDIRRRILAAVTQFPGIHLREAARRVETSLALVEYHVPILVGAGLVREERGEPYVRLFPATGAGGQLTPAERRILGVLRERNPLAIVLVLLGSPQPLRHGAIATATGLGKSHVSFHLRKLEAAGIVVKHADGEHSGHYAVEQPALVQRLLVANKPVPDLLDEFADVWDALYGA